MVLVLIGLGLGIVSGPSDALAIKNEGVYSIWDEAQNRPMLKQISIQNVLIIFS
jgi:hypothetical protein